MLGYRKRSFISAHRLLTRLREGGDDLANLRSLQALLLGEILLTENRIRPLKAELRTIDPDSPATNLKRYAFLHNRIEGLRRCAFIWRCFGDAIAFHYMDKYALKQTLYNTDNYNPKQGAGFIGGKDGLAMELAALDEFIDGGIPALLVDITNTIRHGDVCVMVGPDPMLIEVKASEKKLNPRGRKQVRSLEMLHTFFVNDKVSGLRGMGEVQRRVSGVDERTYVDRMNACISKAMDDGYAIEQPEIGLFYIATTVSAPSIQEIFSKIGLRRPPVVYGWNFEKNQQTWAPFSPFTLSIKNVDALWNFIEGKLFVLVAVEVDQLVAIATENGVAATYDEQRDPQYPFRFETLEGEALGDISRQMIARIGMECVSPQTLIQGALAMYRSYLNEPPNGLNN